MFIVFLVIGLLILCMPLKTDSVDKSEELRAQLHAERAGKLLADSTDPVTQEILLTLCEIEIENHKLLHHIKKNTYHTSRIATFGFKLTGVACIILGIVSFFSLA